MGGHAQPPASRFPAGGPREKPYTSRVVLILVALAVAVFGLIRLGKPLEPKQRVVLVLVFIAGLAYLILTLVQLRVLGRTTPEP
jgi:hypothetical protein